MIEFKVSADCASELFDQLKALAQLLGSGSLTLEGKEKISEKAARELAKEMDKAMPEVTAEQKTPAAAKAEPTEQKPAAAKEKPQEAKTEPEAPAVTKAKAEPGGGPEEVDEKTLRKFCAQALKVGGVNSAAIIKEISGGIAKINQIDPALYPNIYAAVREAWDKKAGA